MISEEREVKDDFIIKNKKTFLRLMNSPLLKMENGQNEFSNRTCINKQEQQPLKQHHCVFGYLSMSIIK